MPKQDLKKAKANILQRAIEIECPFEVSEELKLAYCKARAIDEFLLKEYFSKQTPPTEDSLKKQTKKILKDFEKAVVTKLSEAKNDFEKLRKSAPSKQQNLFLIAGTKSLYLSNKFTRTITTTLGNRLEDILEIDKSKCFDAELQLNLKIKGIDKFIFDKEGKIRHVQVKTKKDTLTGSQAKRSVIELGIHPNPIFAALFDLGSWHFPNHPKISRMTGEEFWELAGLDYDFVLTEVCKSLQRIEKKLFNF